MSDVDMIVQCAVDAHSNATFFGAHVRAIAVPAVASDTLSRKKRFGASIGTETPADPELADDWSRKLTNLRLAMEAMRSDGPVDHLQSAARSLGERAQDVQSLTTATMESLRTEAKQVGDAVAAHIRTLREQIAAAERAMERFTTEVDVALRAGELAESYLTAVQVRVPDFVEEDFET